MELETPSNKIMQYFRREFTELKRVVAVIVVVIWLGSR